MVTRTLLIGVNRIHSQNDTHAHKQPNSAFGIYSIEKAFSFERLLLQLTRMYRS